MKAIDKSALKAAAERFYDYLFDIRGYSQKTVESYADAIDTMIADVTIVKEEERTVLDLFAWRRRIQPLSKKSIALKLSAVRAFVAYLNENEGVCVVLRADDSVKVPKTLPKPIDASLVSEVLEQSDRETRLIILMLYGLGLRISELASLPLDAIEAEWVRVYGKGGKERRIPLPESLHKEIERYRAEIGCKRYLFEKGGAPLNASQLRYRMQKAFRKHGIKASPHQLRHSFATHLLNNGARIADVSELLGHATMATTQIYTKLGSAKKMQSYMQAHPLARGKV